MTTQIWNQEHVNETLQKYIDGELDLSYIRDGVGVAGVPFYGIGDRPLASMLRRVWVSPNDVLNCSLKNPCEPPPDCDEVGATFTATKPRYKMRWAFYALWAIRNLNQQFVDEYQAIQGAAIESTLDTFNVDIYWPKPGHKFSLLIVLTGLGLAFAIISGILGYAAAAATGVAGAIGAAAPAVATYFERSYTANLRSDPIAAQKTFAKQVRQVYDLFVEELNNVANAVFSDNLRQEEISLQDVLQDGSWVNPQQITEVPDAQKQAFIEIFSRSIDLFWKTPTSNKMWVLFVDLQDGAQSTYNCDDDNTGPQDLEYYGNGGVYYAYNFVEKGDHQGYIGYPWGANKTLEKIGIDPKVSIRSLPGIYADQCYSGLSRALLDHTAS